jgi:hypothetical protein
VIPLELSFGDSLFALALKTFEFVFEFDNAELIFILVKKHVSIVFVENEYVIKCINKHREVREGEKYETEENAQEILYTTYIAE